MNDALAKSIDQIDLAFLRQEYCERFGRNDCDFDEASKHLKTFFKVVSHTNVPLAMTSKQADDLWHTFILFTPQYRAFCARFFGKYVDHQPHTNATPVPALAFLNWFEALEDEVGSIDEFWLRDLPVHVQRSLIEKKIPDVTALKWSGWTGA